MAAKKKSQTRLQAKANKAGRIVTGPKGSKPQSTTNAAIQKQGNKITRGGLGSGRPSGTVSQTRSKPIGTGGGGITKPSGTPRMVNANKPTMQRLVRKAAQVRKAGAGRPLVKPVEAQRLMSQRAPRIREGAQKLRTIGDNGRVRAAQQRGQEIRKAAEVLRGAKQAMGRMGNTLARARFARGPASAIASVVAEAGLSPLAEKAGTKLGKALRPVGRAIDNALPGVNSKDEALRRNSQAAAKGSTSKFKGAREKAVAKAKSIKGSPVVGAKKSTAGQFDSAFAAARKAGKSTFTWRGKKYTTKMK